MCFKRLRERRERLKNATTFDYLDKYDNVKEEDLRICFELEKSLSIPPVFVIFSGVITFILIVFSLGFSLGWSMDWFHMFALVILFFALLFVLKFTSDERKRLVSNYFKYKEKLKNKRKQRPKKINSNTIYSEDKASYLSIFWYILAASIAIIVVLSLVKPLYSLYEIQEKTFVTSAQYISPDENTIEIIQANVSFYATPSNFLDNMQLSVGQILFANGTVIYSGTREEEKALRLKFLMVPEDRAVIMPNMCEIVPQEAYLGRAVVDINLPEDKEEELKFEQQYVGKLLRSGTWNVLMCVEEIEPDTGHKKNNTIRQDMGTHYIDVLRGKELVDTAYAKQGLEKINEEITWVIITAIIAVTVAVWGIRFRRYPQSKDLNS